MKSIHDVLAELRESAFDERHKGDLFEALTKKYLEIDPFYRTYFDKVWLYGDWAKETGLSKQDIGIDLVARISESGEIVAIQCKFYAEGAYLDKKEIDSFFTASGKEPFRERYIFSTTDNWSKHASDAVEGQQIPTNIIRVQDLDDSGIDWSGFSLEDPTKLGLLKKKTPFPHQLEAIEAAKSHFQNHDRGKMIMACGTGKTYTSLQIVQEMTPKGGTVLFLVPSLALLSQTLKEWKREANTEFRAYAVCSDSKLSRQSSSEDTRVADLAYPSTTNVEKLAAHFNKGTESELTVIFSTYQSIDVVAQAQSKGLPEFDLIVCDEAHRTTGVTLVDEDESAFVRVHDNNFIKGSKRLYMTATPRIFAEASKAKAEEASAVIASMDDETKFGEEFHRLNFGNAVSRGLLSDYKVLVLTVSETQVSKSLQKILTDGDELKLQDAIKIVGCYNGLRKRGANEDDFLVDKTPMRTAVAFSRSIKDSKRIAELFSTVTTALNEEAKEKNALKAEADHVDGTFNVLARNEKLDWLKDKKTENTVRVLSNARCLSEGVDVPALDAVLFLNPRDSQVDVVQSVGRVMRKAEGKQYGYVILPIAVPAGKSAEEALADNKNYKVVWQVLQALRAHDERFDALVNKIDLTGDTGNVIEVIDASPGRGGDDWDGNSSPKEKPADLVPLFDFDFADWKDAILAKIVQKVGQRTYWENWAKDVTDIAKNHISRITHLVTNGEPELQDEFAHFLKGLRDNLNPSISQADAIEMLAQHLITKPVFDALFEGYAFTEMNPVSISMQRMVLALEKSSINKESDALEGFYESVRLRASGIDDGAAKQKIVKELYEKFFRLAFSDTSEKLGIVYTPNEVVDFIIHSVDVILKKHFDSGLGQSGVDVLDPFTGTGTFIVRLLQSGLISKDQLNHKFRYELHANEIVLLAYYVAAINIEETYHSLMGSYEPFQGVVLTDTFQMNEGDDQNELPGMEVFPENNERVIAQKNREITVIIGNPPYSVGQSSANDDNANASYPSLDARITSTYAARTVAQNKNNLYDSYIRAIRWGSDRLGPNGVLAYVTNNGYVDSNTAAGLRKELADEFSDIFVFNYRGNSRNSGETAKKEGGNIFNIRVGVAVVFLVKRQSNSGQAKIEYFEFDDYLTASEKLTQTAEFQSIDRVPWVSITPNSEGDWINQRSSEFSKFIAIGSKDKADKNSLRIFGTYTAGLKSNRDSWAYNFSKKAVVANMKSMIDFYNHQVEEYKAHRTRGESWSRDNDPTKISWDTPMATELERQKTISQDSWSPRLAMYRPFTKQWLAFGRSVNNSVHLLPKLFPETDSSNFGFYCVGMGSTVPFSVFMSKDIPDFHLTGAGSGGQFFTRYSFEEAPENPDLFSSGSEGGRVDNITDEALEEFRLHFGSEVTKDDVFYYVFGVLHSMEYRDSFSADLRKMLPKIPKSRNFFAFASAGRELAEMQLNYETLPALKLDISKTGNGSTKVSKMTFAKSGKKTDTTSIVVNSDIVVSGIPVEAHRYRIGAKSPLEWLVERYQVKTNDESGLLNDVNAWFDESGSGDDILGLIGRIAYLSVESDRIITGLPKLDLLD